MAKQKPTGFTPQGQHPQWVQDPSGQWHPVAAAPTKQTNPWMAVGWIVLILLMVPCVLGGLFVGITALGAASDAPTTTTRPAVSTTVR